MFGATPASPFGAPPASPSAFGAPAASPFGAASQQNAFNASAGSSSPFGGANSTLRPQGTVFGAGGGALGATGGQARASSTRILVSPKKPKHRTQDTQDVIGNTVQPLDFYSCPFLLALAAANACRFWNKGSCRFGASCRNQHVCSTCGSSAHKAINCSMLPGTGGYRVTRVTDKELLTQNQHYAMMHSICAMQENQHKSVEEIRHEAYAKAGEPLLPGSSPSNGFGQPPGVSGPFGTPATSGFGGGAASGGGLFGAPAPASPLGSAGGSSFAPASTSPFGAASTTFGGANPVAGGPFGGAAPAAPGAFGGGSQGASGGFGSTAASGAVFGSSSPAVGAFGTPNTSAFGGGASGSAFGGSPAVSGGAPFGTTSPASGAFGSLAPAPANPFNASSTPAFGATAFTPSFGAAAPAPAFGGGTGIFGTPAPTPAYGGSSLGGGSAFGAPTSSPAFGAAASSPHLVAAVECLAAPLHLLLVLAQEHLLRPLEERLQALLLVLLVHFRPLARLQLLVLQTLLGLPLHLQRTHLALHLLRQRVD